MIYIFEIKRLATDNKYAETSSLPESQYEKSSNERKKVKNGPSARKNYFLPVFHLKNTSSAKQK